MAAITSTGPSFNCLTPPVENANDSHSPEDLAKNLKALQFLFIESTPDSVHSTVYRPGEAIDYEDAVSDYLDNLALRQLGRLGFATSPQTWEGNLRDFSPERINQIQEAADALFTWKVIEEAIGLIPDFSTISSYDQLIDHRGQLLGWINQHKDEIHKLETLTLDYTCFLTSLPEEIGELEGLKELNLERNLCVTLPDSICQLPNLETLDVMWNRLTSLPESLGKLTKLKVLNAAQNKLTRLPKSTSDLGSLKELILFDNALTTYTAKVPSSCKIDLRHNFIPSSPLKTKVSDPQFFEAAKAHFDSPSFLKSAQQLLDGPSSQERSSIVRCEEIDSYVVRKLPAPREPSPAVMDGLGRTENEQKFLEDFEGLFFAARHGNFSRCQELVNQGFRDFNAQCHGSHFSKSGKYDGKSPLQIAKEFEHIKIVELFERTSNLRIK